MPTVIKKILVLIPPIRKFWINQVASYRTATRTLGGAAELIKLHRRSAYDPVLEKAVFDALAALDRSTPLKGEIASTLREFYKSPNLVPA